MIVPCECDFAKSVGNRLLLTSADEVEVCQWRHHVFEAAVVEVSPMGEFVKLTVRGTDAWHDAKRLRLVEVLGVVGKSALEDGT